MRKLHISILIACLSLSPSVFAGELRAAIEDYYADHLEELFVWFHKNPELSFLEHKTAKRLASELLGFQTT